MVEKFIAGTFGLILVFLLLSRAAELTQIIQTIGGFWTQQTRVLQGVGTPGFNSVLPGTSSNPGFAG